MRNDLQQHKKSDKIKWIATALAVVMLGVGVTAAITKGFKDWNPYGWFDKKQEQPADTENPEAPDDNGGSVVNNGEEHGLKMAVAKLAANEYENYGISPLAETAYTLTAVVDTPLDANKVVDWSIYWNDDNSSWAKGKTVADYVTITPSADGALTATLSCLQAFAEKISIQCSSRIDASKYAICTIDYAKRLTDFSVVTKLNGTAVTNIAFDDNQGKYTFEISYTYGIGTIDDGKTPTCTVALNNAFVSALTSKIKKVSLLNGVMSPSSVTLNSVKDNSYTFNYVTSVGNIVNGSSIKWGFFSTIQTFDMETSSRYYSAYISAINNAAKAAISEYSGSIFDFTCTFNGNYSSYNKVKSISKGSVSYNSLSVQGVSLNNSSVVF